MSESLELNRKRIELMELFNEQGRESMEKRVWAQKRRTYNQI